MVLLILCVVAALATKLVQDPIWTGEPLISTGKFRAGNLGSCSCPILSISPSGLAVQFAAAAGFGRGAGGHARRSAEWWHSPAMVLESFKPLMAEWFSRRPRIGSFFACRTATLSSMGGPGGRPERGHGFYQVGGGGLGANPQGGVIPRHGQPACLRMADAEGGPSIEMQWNPSRDVHVSQMGKRVDFGWGTGHYLACKGNRCIVRTNNGLRLFPPSDFRGIRTFYACPQPNEASAAAAWACANRLRSVEGWFNRYGSAYWLLADPGRCENPGS